MNGRDVRVVLASAGSGKTWQLTTHFLKKLARGVEPERVLASTFTRKAAGEILARVLSRLADGAGGAASANELARQLDLRPDERPDFAQLLATCVRNVQRFRVRTLDAFFAEVVGGMAAELGLPPDWNIAEELELRREQSRAIAAALASRPVREWAVWLAELERADATRGVHEALMRTVRDAYALAQDSEAQAWGRFEPLPVLAADELMAAVERLARAPMATRKDGVPLSSWTKARRALEDAVDNQDWQCVADSGFGAAVIAGKTLFDKCEMSADLRDAVVALVLHAAGEVGRELARQSRSARRVLDAFDVEYARGRTRRGALSFDDLPRALAGGDALARERLDELAFRLDARIDHVLLDEFQDTSPMQWRVLEPLVQELASDGSGQRSVFVVGDVKQSIYGWRSADPGLLELLPLELAVEPTSLDVSYRSAQTVLDAVNRLFGRIAESPVLATREHGAAVARRFAASFHQHEAKHAHAGEVRVHTCAAAESSDESYEQALKCSVEIVSQIRATAPAASVAVLLRRKLLVSRLVYLLRQRGLFASGESGNQLGDSAAVQVVLSLLQLIDHPDDTAARFHVATSPLAAELGLSPDGEAAAQQRIARELHARIAELGLAQFLESLRSAVVRGFDAWDVRRFGQLVDAAFAWPEAQGLRTSDFVERARAQPVDDSSAAQIKVMTVHAAKGLEFDAVVLPELDLQFARKPPPFLWRRRDDDPRCEIEAVARSVNQKLRALLAYAGEPTLRELERATGERALRDELSALYVAVTRAAHRLDLIVRPEGSDKPRFSAAALVRQAYDLGHGELPANSEVAAEPTNDAAWTRVRQPQTGVEATRAREPRPLRFAAALRTRELERATPSHLEPPRERATGELFSPADAGARLRGSRFHAWFERLEWLEGFDAADASLLACARGLGFDGDELERDLADFRRALERPNLRRLLAHRAGAQVWRERRFTLVLGSQARRPRLVSGAFDRVVIADGRAELIDFKSDRVAAAELALRVERYRPQMAAYREALARITGLAAEGIAAKLVFVELDEVVEL